MLKTENLSYWIDEHCLLSNLDLSFEPNKFHVIMGANGAGKTTLLRLLAGNLQPTDGEVFLFDKAVRKYPKKELAGMRAVLSQHYQIAFPIGASDIVMMGRYPFFNTAPTRNDRDICSHALQLMQSHDLSQREYGTLSGGEAQKIQMSRVLSQIWEAGETNEKILFLDEPVSHLDLKYQHQLLKKAKEFCKRHVTVVAILHDINLAFLYADRIIFLKQGKLVHDTSSPSSISPISSKKYLT
jgi:iron complex transport system ATP-binding protein